MSEIPTDEEFTELVDRWIEAGSPLGGSYEPFLAMWAAWVTREILGTRLLCAELIK